MYTRAYFPDEEKIKVPENYVGNAFGEERAEGEKDGTGECKAEEMPSGEAVHTMRRTDGAFGSIFKGRTLGSLFGGFDIFKGAFSNIGTEEILIIGIALFLLLSEGGDKECALMLFFLLFIR